MALDYVRIDRKVPSPAIPKMTSEQLFVMVIVVVVASVLTIILVSKNRHRIKRVILDRLNLVPRAERRKPHEPVQPFTEGEPRILTEEESEAELERLQELIEDRKQIAWDTDLSHHLWGLYKNLLQYTSSSSVDSSIQDGEWYAVKILQVSTQNGLNKLEFELKGARYKFVDDEENQGWCDHIKLFSLFLYDDSGRCLIEVPMKLRVDKSGRKYSILSEGPKAFLPGDWISDFINVKLKHQSIRNREIRAQKHQERLSEIQDLRDRFGLWD